MGNEMTKVCCDGSALDRPMHTLLSRRVELRVVLVVGCCGAVGAGILHSFSVVPTCYETVGIDTRLPAQPCGFESYSDDELRELLSRGSPGTVPAVILAHDDGTRGVYADNAQKGKQNERRLEAWCLRLRALSLPLAVYYIGGSWTKRQVDASSGFCVKDDTPNKTDVDKPNAYERAKIDAEACSERLAGKLGMSITFVDMISVVPNLAPAFTVARMVDEAQLHERITASAAEYGRALLHTDDAGEALRAIVDNDHKGLLLTKASPTATSEGKFTRRLIPGVFIAFEEFAAVVREEVQAAAEAEGEDVPAIEMVTQATTPDFLRARTESAHLEALGWTADKAKVLDALRLTARSRIASNQRV